MLCIVLLSNAGDAFFANGFVDRPNKLLLFGVCYAGNSISVNVVFSWASVILSVVVVDPISIPRVRDYVKFVTVIS